jgi:hypothetical protein
MSLNATSYKRPPVLWINDTLLSGILIGVEVEVRNFIGCSSFELFRSASFNTFRGPRAGVVKATVQAAVTLEDHNRSSS